MLNILQLNCNLRGEIWQHRIVVTFFSGGNDKISQGDLKIKWTDNE